MLTCSGTCLVAHECLVRGASACALSLKQACDAPGTPSKPKSRTASLQKKENHASIQGYWVSNSVQELRQREIWLAYKKHDSATHLLLNLAVTVRDELLEVRNGSCVYDVLRVVLIVLRAHDVADRSQRWFRHAPAAAVATR